MGSIIKTGNPNRRIFIGGLKNPDNLTLPPENSGLYLLDFTSPYKDTSVVIGDVVRNATNIAQPKEIHIYNPNNIVIADFNWLKANWSKVEEWYENNEESSYIEDCVL